MGKSGSSQQNTRQGLPPEIIYSHSRLILNMYITQPSMITTLCCHLHLKVNKLDGPESNRM